MHVLESVNRNVDFAYPPFGGYDDFIFLKNDARHVLRGRSDRPGAAASKKLSCGWLPLKRRRTRSG